MILKEKERSVIEDLQTPLILNASHPLVQYITEHQDGENAEMICEQLYDLAKLQHAPLSADAMTKFVARSNDIMMLLTK